MADPTSTLGKLIRDALGGIAHFQNAAGQAISVLLDANGNVPTSIGTLLSGEDQTANRLLVEQRNTATYMSTATTTTAKTGTGFLHLICIEGGTLGTIIIYDNTAGSGTILASFDATAARGSYELDVAFTTGLTIVTGAATQLTVSWR